MNTGRKTNIFIKILRQQKDGLAKKASVLKRNTASAVRHKGHSGKGGVAALSKLPSWNTVYTVLVTGYNTN